MFHTSRYQFSIGATDADGNLYLSAAEQFRYQKLDDNIPHLVEGGDTLFSIAAKHYADEPRGAGYWWAIAHFQPEPVCHDPTIKLDAGTVIIVPSLMTLRSKIMNARRRREERT